MEGTAAAAVAAAASGPSNFTPELRMAAVTTARTNTNVEGNARAGRDSSTGRTAAAAAVAVAVAEATEADMTPAMVEERAEEAAEAAGAAETEWPAGLVVANQMASIRYQYYQLSGL
jgi:hypothetical protein